MDDYKEFLKKIKKVSSIRKYTVRNSYGIADYYKYYTGREWTDARNYDLCLDSSKLGFERCVDEIIAYMNVRFK